ncbi:hypothetical protein, partial [Pseudomonas sp.]|uniref:hypothetical protein n=1 Tax=Pseudomonas sp. TaxID=306 RepID=UPI0035664367
KLTKPKAKSDSCEPCYARPANSGWSWFMQLRFLRAKTMSYILFDESQLAGDQQVGRLLAIAGLPAHSKDWAAPAKRLRLGVPD